MNLNVLNFQFRLYIFYFHFFSLPPASRSRGGYGKHTINLVRPNAAHGNNTNASDETAATTSGGTTAVSTAVSTAASSVTATTTNDETTTARCERTPATTEAAQGEAAYKRWSLVETALHAPQETPDTGPTGGT